MSDPNRTAIAVTVLAEDLAARKLRLAWPLVPRGLPHIAATAQWSRVSGVALVQTRRLAEVLFAHRLVHEDGTVDPEALRVVHHLAAETLRGTKGSRR